MTYVMTVIGPRTPSARVRKRPMNASLTRLSQPWPPLSVPPDPRRSASFVHLSHISEEPELSPVLLSEREVRNTRSHIHRVRSVSDIFASVSGKLSRACTSLLYFDSLHYCALSGLLEGPNSPSLFESSLVDLFPVTK